MREFRTLGSVRGAGRNRTRPAKVSPYRDRSLLSLPVASHRTAHRPTFGSMGDAEVQTIEGKSKRRMGLVARCSPALSPALRSLEPFAHFQPTCKSRMS